MNPVAQEIAGYEAEFVHLLEAWNALSEKDRRREWDRYTRAIDEGGAGWTKFAAVLAGAWCEGFDPTAGMVRDREVGLVPARAAAPA